jgi:CheY-like chemotaxis protein
MLHFFRACPDLVRWELTLVEQAGPYRLALHHANGVIVEYFDTSAAALVRIHELEQLLAATILIIDDNVVLARAFARVLSDAGYSVHTWHSAEDGLRQAKVQPPDAIILDFQMPFVNGVGFLYRLRADPTLRDTPVMVVTGVALNEQRVSELAELGAIVRLKPIGVEQLLAETRGLLTYTCSTASPVAPVPSVVGAGARTRSL